MLLAWVTMAAWRGHIGSVFYFLHSDGSSFFFLTTLVPYFVLIIYLAIVTFGLTKYSFFNRVEFNWTVSIYIISFILTKSVYVPQFHGLKKWTVTVTVIENYVGLALMYYIYLYGN